MAVTEVIIAYAQLVLIVLWIPRYHVNKLFLVMYLLNTGRMIQVCWLVLLVEASPASRHPVVRQPNLLQDVFHS